MARIADLPPRAYTHNEISQMLTNIVKSDMQARRHSPNHLFDANCVPSDERSLIPAAGEARSFDNVETPVFNSRRGRHLRLLYRISDARRRDPYK